MNKTLAVAASLLVAVPLAAQTADTAASPASAGAASGRSGVVGRWPRRARCRAPTSTTWAPPAAGVFKTTDGGATWTPVTDRYFGGTIGAIAVERVQSRHRLRRAAESTRSGATPPMATGCTRPPTRADLDLHGPGRDPAHLQDPDPSHATPTSSTSPRWGRSSGRARAGASTRPPTAAGPGPRSCSGTIRTGAIDLSMDPSNPEVLYAGLWEAYRKPWQLVSGGPGSGIFKTTDGGEPGRSSPGIPGMPAGLIGQHRHLGIAAPTRGGSMRRSRPTRAGSTARMTAATPGPG